MRARRFRTMTAGAAALLVALGSQLLVVGAADAGPDVNPPGSAALASEVQAKFAAFGNVATYDHWTGGDGLEAIELPDGRVLWFFNDYFHGTVNADLTRDPFQAVMPRNGIVIQNADGSMGLTVSGADRSTLVNTAAGGWLWGGDQRLQGGNVQKFYMRMVDDGAWGKAVGVELRSIPVGSVANPATYSDLSGQLPAQVRNCSPTADHCTLWGMGLADHGGYTYVYGSDKAGAVKTLRIARVPQGDFAAAGWRFWTGSGWSSDPDAAADTHTVASEALSVTYQSGRWVLVTQDTAGALEGNVISYYSDTPWGFTAAEKSVLFAMPETTTDAGVWSYTPRVLPHLSTSGNQVVVGYSVNSQLRDGACGQHNYIDATVYRPRFRAVTLPATATGGANVGASGTNPAPWTWSGAPWCGADASVTVPSPSSLSATAISGNTGIRYSWTQPSYASSSWSYVLQFRPAGGTWSDEMVMWTPTSRSWAPGLLNPGRTYDFRVRAVTWMQNRQSAWSTSTFTIPVDTPTGLSVARTAANRCSLTITDPQGGVFWKVQSRQAGTTAWGTAVQVGTKTPWFAVTSGVRYDYRVRAYSDYGQSAWTTDRRCSL